MTFKRREVIISDLLFELVRENLELIVYATGEGSDKPAQIQSRQSIHRSHTPRRDMGECPSEYFDMYVCSCLFKGRLYAYG